MAINLLVELPLTLREATRLPQLQRDGRRPHIASLYRWVTAGARGIRLESVVVGGARCTTSEAVDRWIAALTAAAAGDAHPTRTPTQRQRDHDRADATLAKNGW